MIPKDQDEGDIIQRFKVLRVPSNFGSPLASQIIRWKKCSGLQWCISRLKSLKVDLIRRKAGLPPLTWIRKNRKGDIHGPIGSLMRWAMKSDKNFRIAIQVFQVYTFWVYPKITEAQFKKFYSAVTAEPDPLPLSLKRDVENTCKNYEFFRTKIPLPDSILLYQGCPSKKGPMIVGRSVPQDKNIKDEVYNIIYPSNVFLFHKYGNLFDSLFYGFEPFRKWMSDVPRREDSPPYVGKVAFIQEPGGKLRSVASPFRVFQMVLQPFSNYLYKIAKDLPWDCTHDQTKPFASVQEHLKNRRRVHSIDLSSFTDYFPIDLQISVVKNLIIKDDFSYLELWKDLSQGQWKLPDGNFISWRRGQPLGMLPSFAIATITHGFLLKSLLNRPWRGEFYVLGDDVIILDDDLYTSYMETLSILGCPFSQEKSISSSNVAEFAGKVITEFSVIPQMKWRQISDDNFLDLCKALGPLSRNLLRPKQKKVFDKVAHLCEPYGLNFSLPNDNWVKMFIRTLSSPLCQESSLSFRFLLELRQKINHTLYEDSFLGSKISLAELKRILATFDEKVRLVMLRLPFAYDSFLSLLNGFDSLPSVLDNQDLPFKTKNPSRVSVLERYSRILLQE